MCGVVFSASVAASTPGTEPDAALYRYAAPGPWVDRIELDYGATVPAGGAADGMWYLLLDRQVDVLPGGDDAYRHVAIKLLNADGVDGSSQIDLVVDPTYQSLTLHSLRIVREGKVIDARPSARITALPQETELQKRIYNGRYNVNILLADVRVGDVIEYDYTLHSREKNFPGHFATDLSVGWSVPVRQQRVRLRYPAERAMRLRRSDGGDLPAVRTVGATSEFVLEGNDLAAIPADDDRPAWHTPWPYLQATDLPDWSAVSQMLRPMYGIPQSVGPGVAAVVAQIRAQGGPVQQQALHALQYVQEQIRYTSISIGPGAFRPADPEKVLERRFGDCKDKALLLVTMLRELGIEADVALVNSNSGRILHETLPTPYAFDHAIVRAAIGPAVYWLDATAAKQHSALSTDTPADFERALPVHGSARELEAVPRPSPRSGERHVAVALDLRDGLQKPGTIDITTRYRGGMADRMRSALSNGSREQRQADYVNYLATYYPGVRVGKAFTVEDDTHANELAINEQYVMAEPFRENDAGELELVLHADELYRYGDALESSVRTSPLALAFPVHVTQVITAHLPEDWTIKPGKTAVDNPAFRYRGQIEYAARTLTLTYEYQALKDEVEPAALAQYQADRKRFYDDIGYQLTRDMDGAARSKPFAVAPLPLVAIVLALVLGGWSGWRWFHRYDPEPASAPAGAPVGIRGWLLLPALTAAVTPLVLLVSTATWGEFIGADLWHALPDTVTAAYRASVQPVLLLIVGSQTLLLCWSIVVAALFLRKRSSLPKTYVTFLWVTTIAGAATLAYIGLAGLDDEFALPELARTVASDAILAAVWTTYMFQSARVAATFRARASDHAGARPQT
jgi:transglutaminase-like putative cysteine protease